MESGVGYIEEDAAVKMPKVYFQCKCEKMAGVNYACRPMYKLLQTLFDGAYDHQQMAKLYWDMEKCG